MKINIDAIFKFYEVRLSCHVRAVNYFASLLGYSFPEHDSDKITEPIRTGYAYIFYNNYHTDLHLSDEYFKLCQYAQQTHYKHASHHIQFYSDVSEIPDIRIYEMVSDWASANFEQSNFLPDKNTPSLEKWFEYNMSHLPWTEHQLGIIKKSFETIKNNTDSKTVINIWKDLLELL